MHVSANSARKSLDFCNASWQTNVAVQHTDHHATTGFEQSFSRLKETQPMNATSQEQIRAMILRVLSDVAPNAATQ
ncbi:MAG: hypothetical protein WAT67_03315, partial [Candidatus Contendobacter sp.]